MTNGLTGNARFNNGQWLGFLGEDFEAVVDLESTQTITEIGVNILKLHWQRMWEPTELIFYVSGNGKHFKEVYRTSDFPENAINKVRVRIKPTKALYVKVLAKNKGIIPEGKYGAGGKPWLLVDEIIIN